MRNSYVMRLSVLFVAAVVAMGGCSAAEEPLSVIMRSSEVTLVGEQAPTTSVSNSPAGPTVTASDADDDGADDRSWATRLVAEVDPVTLEQVGPGIPAGHWAESAVVTDDVIAFTTWAEEEMELADPRWRLVVADRGTGAVLVDERIGDMNVLGMFSAPSGEVLVVEPIRSDDWNHADGFTVLGADPADAALREIARFDDGDLQPWAMSVLDDRLLGVIGWERNDTGVFDRVRVVVFDWTESRSVVDVVLEGLPVEGDEPDELFTGFLGHTVAWDIERSRAIVVHAHEDAVTTVEYTSGDIQRVELVADQSLLEALFSWWIPPAQAKGLPASERHAVISGDRLFVAGSSLSYSDGDDSIGYSYAPVDLITVDLDSLKITNRSEAPVGFVTAVPNGGYLLGGGRFESGSVGTYITTDQQTTSGLLVIDPQTLEIIETHDVDVAWAQYLQPTASGDAIYVEGGVRGTLRFDPVSGTVSQIDTTMPWEAALIEHGLSYTRDAN